MKVASLLLIGILTAGASLGAQTTRIVQRILVKVNGEIFTQTDLVKRQSETLRDKGFKTDQPDSKMIQALQELTPDLLIDVVDELMLIQYGRELGFKMTDTMFNTSMEDLKKRFSLDDAGLKAGLLQEGYTMPEYRRMLERQFIVNQVERQESQKTQVTDEEARQYYEKHRDEFKSSATVTIVELMVAVPTDAKGQFSVGADEDAKAKVQAIKERVAKGEDFAKLVTELSDSASKASGGVMGPINLTDIDPSLRAKLEPLKPGDVTEPLRTAKGYTLFKMDKRTDASPRPFTEVHDDILEKIYGDRMEAETQKLITKLRSHALIEWKDEGMKKAYERALAARVSK